MSISGIMCVWEEEIMAPYAIKSIAEYVDELVVINKPGRDNTENVIRQTCSDEDLPLIFKNSEDKLRYVRLKAFKLASSDWCLIVDGDEVYHTDGPAGVHTLTSLTDNRMCYRAPMNYLYIDFNHTRSNQKQQVTHKFFYPNDDKVMMNQIRDLPAYIGGTELLNDVYKFNCGIKNPERIYERRWWYEWSKIYDGPMSFPDWIKVNKSYSDDYKNVILYNKILYDEKKWGRKPKLLR